MYSVTRRVRKFKQPRGGYVRPRDFCVTILNDGLELSQTENISPNLVGMAVDYLTRYMMGGSANESFRISFAGAMLVGEQKYAAELLWEIDGLRDKSIINACKLVGYDVCFRAGAGLYKPVQTINPDEATISNIRIMVNRNLNFLNDYGPVTLSGFTFKGGYTEIISSGDGDFATADTLWDIKVSRDPPTTKHTLQLLIYYLMGKKSEHAELHSIRNIGLYNPRTNRVYTLDVESIPPEIIDVVSTEVIGYPK